MKVLILAEVCNPDWPSLPVVGYNTARAIANYVDTTVVTQVRNRPYIERVGMGRAEVVYIDTERLAAPIHALTRALQRGKGVGWSVQIALSYPSYLFFEWLVWQRFQADLQNGHFQVVHRLTPMTPTLPSPMASFSPVPFLLGPLNGNLPWPTQFKQEQVREFEWMRALREGYKFLPFYRATYHRSAGILAAFDHTIAEMPQASQSKVINFPEVGIDPALFQQPERSPHPPMTILFAGRLVPYKLPEVVIRAFAQSPQLQCHWLVMAGDGPERPRLEQLIAEHQLHHCVELTGQISQAQVGQLMRQADIFAFPSIRELGAGAVVEAMACGMACVVVDYGGPATLVASDRGIKVPLGNLEQITQCFTQALEQLVNDPQRVVQLGRNAHDHAMRHYTWDTKAHKLVEIYQWLGRSPSTPPNFWEPCAMPLPLEEASFVEASTG